MWLSLTVSIDFFPKRKKILCFNKLKVILRMTAKLGILAWSTDLLGEKGFVFKRHEKIATNTLHVFWKQNLIVSWDLELWSAVIGPHVLMTVGHTTQASGLHGYTPSGAGARPAPCSLGVCLTLWGDLLPHCAQQSGQAKITNFRPYQASNNSQKWPCLLLRVFEITSVLGPLQLLCAARSHGW